MIKRAGEEVTVGMQNTEMLHDWDRVTKSPFFIRGGDKNQGGRKVHECRYQNHMLLQERSQISIITRTQESHIDA